MIPCPNCGIENAPARAACAVCGEPLAPSTPDEPPPIDDEGLADLDWLLAEEPPAAPQSPPTDGDDVPDVDWLLASLEEERPPVPLDPTEDEGVDGLLDSLAADEADAAPPLTKPTTPPKAPPANPNLPAWLRGADVVPEPPRPRFEEEWDEALDFSDLPDWEPEAPADQKRPKEEETAARKIKPLSAEDPIQAAEIEGAGLLSGVAGPIPIEPVITLTHDTPTIPSRTEPLRHEMAANLFARIAGGAVVPEPIALPKAPPRGVGWFQLLLLLVIIVPLIFSNTSFLGTRPPSLPGSMAFAEMVEAVPDGGTVLLAFDYEGGVAEELQPAAIATLSHLRRVAAPTNAAPRDLTLVALSTTPQGTALAELAWQQSEGATVPWRVVPYLAGNTIGLRSLMEERFTSVAGVTMSEVALVVVLANETSDVQHWLEQVGAQLPDLPIVAIAPATAETTLTPYLASGQLDGLVAGLPGTASYEIHGMGQADGIAWRRIDAVTLGALLVFVVILAGNLISLNQQRRARREPIPDEDDAALPL